MMKFKESKVIKNASWIIVCRIFQSILGLIVTMLSARYLGPSNYGVINYAASVVAFVVPVVQLGLNNILVQEFINSPDREGKILGTALLTSAASAILNIFGVFAFVSIVNVGEKVTIAVCALYSIMLFFQALELTQYWFQAKYMSKYMSIVSLVAYFLISGYKIFLLAMQKSIYWFAISNALDYMLIAVTLLLIYKKLGGQKLEFSFAECKRLVAKSSSYIVSGIMAVIFAQTDRVMLKLMGGNEEVGIYSAACTCAGMVSFVFAAIIDSMRPYILEAKKDNENEYQTRIKLLYSITIYLALAYSLFCSIFSGPIIGILYGSAYADSVGVLRLVVWYTTFAYFGGAQGIWMLAEGKQKYLMLLGTSGAILNVAINAILIPFLHAVGAALASVITQIFANVLLCCMIPALRDNVKLLFQSLNPRPLVAKILSLLKK